MRIGRRAGERTSELVEKGKQPGIIGATRGDRPVRRDTAQLACEPRGAQHEGERAGPEHLGQTTGIGWNVVCEHIEHVDIMHEPGQHLIGGTLLEFEDARVSHRAGKSRKAVDSIGRDDHGLSIA